jgi:hypothetical protein
MKYTLKIYSKINYIIVKIKKILLFLLKEVAKIIIKIKHQIGSITD